MSNPSQARQADDAFAGFFTQAEASPHYWAELAKLEFTEKVLARMKELGLSRSALAARLGVQPGLVTRLLSGRNNFELGTMTKIARALDCEFRCHLQPQGQGGPEGEPQMSPMSAEGAAAGQGERRTESTGRVAQRRRRGSGGRGSAPAALVAEVVRLPGLAAAHLVVNR